ncbi:NACHT, LRR and PYD domains-containing protein 1-like protein [Lates japonicus]|uniref:NACHT, LRR and PYD domains-containing protein 1-like protein n=1 Tax=Lates japonicus TaxID=270547 RepID=A0AAD3N4J3_LATJO|nr:NACHT, LRR and PYD domains-containing protein 1-like protein [Lates japonicus]
MRWASLRVSGKVIQASTVKTCASGVKLDPNRADTKKLDVSEHNTKKLDMSENNSKKPHVPEDKERMLDVSVDNTKLMTDPSSFTPELQTKSTRVSYRFRCPGPGGFRCSSTGLVIVVAQEAELLYRTVQWDESQLQSAGKMAAGPLFDIQCPEDVVCQLHLPHCETKDGKDFTVY